MNPIAEFLEKGAISQTWFGKQLGVSQGLVQHWLTGRRPVTLETALDIEERFGIDAESLNADLKSLFERLEKRTLRKLKEKKVSVNKT